MSRPPLTLQNVVAEREKGLKSVPALPALLVGRPRAPLALVADDVIGGVPVKRFVPTGARKGVTLIWAHGGGWVFMSVDALAAVFSVIASIYGVEIVAVKYRKAPEHPFPAAYDDVLAVTRAIARVPAAGRVFVGGDSAGD